MLLYIHLSEWDLKWTDTVILISKSKVRCKKKQPIKWLSHKGRVWWWLHLPEVCLLSSCILFFLFVLFILTSGSGVYFFLLANYNCPLVFLHVRVYFQGLNSVTLVFDFLFLHNLGLVDYIFLGMHPFLLGYPICWQLFILFFHNPFYFGSIGWNHFWLYLFFYLTKGFSILLIFKKKSNP